MNEKPSGTLKDELGGRQGRSEVDGERDGVIGDLLGWPRMTVGTPKVDGDPWGQQGSDGWPGGPQKWMETHGGPSE